MTEKLKKIRLLAMDVDGTMTNGSIYISDAGEAMKCFNVKDGLGLSLLRQGGIILAIITGRNSEIVTARASELKIDDVLQGVDNKAQAISELAKKYNISLAEIAYIGDDLNDLPALAIVGLAACPADAVAEVEEKCDLVMQYQGGAGAIREIAERILQAQGKYKKVLGELYHYE